MRTLPALALVVGVIAISMAAPYILLSGLEPFAIAAWRLLSVTVLLLPFAAAGFGRDLAGLTPGERWKLLLSGITYGAHFALFAWAFEHTTKESVVMLLAAQPLLAMAVGRIFLGERITPTMLAATAISLLGLGVFAWNDYLFDPGHLIGDGMVLLCGLLIVISYSIGRRLRPRMSLLGYLLALYLLGGLTCLAAALATGQALWGFHWTNWYYVACAVLIPTLIGHSLFHYVVKYVPVFYVNLAVLAEPVIAILFMLAFREKFEVFQSSQLTMLQGVGGAILLGGVAMGLSAARQLGGNHENENRAAGRSDLNAEPAKPGSGT
ncbi:MAG: DMT family transporter [Planctomycetes bacterium]|nr:DMT family transporter [Planctomycetota bacterium]